MTILDEGAMLIEDLISATEERQILDQIRSARWDTSLRRRVQHYGFRYDYGSQGAAGLTPAPPLPEWAAMMAGRLMEHFETMPEQCIVNEYKPRQGIGMHADHASFGPVVASVSLFDTWPMRFRRRSVRPYARDGMEGDEVLQLPVRSALVLQGRARSDWMHGVCRKDSGQQKLRRLSATFRTIAQ